MQGSCRGSLHTFSNSTTCATGCGCHIFTAHTRCHSGKLARCGSDTAWPRAETTLSPNAVQCRATHARDLL